MIRNALANTRVPTRIALTLVAADIIYVLLAGSRVLGMLGTLGWPQLLPSLVLDACVAIMVSQWRLNKHADQHFTTSPAALAGLAIVAILGRATLTSVCFFLAVHILYPIFGLGFGWVTAICIVWPMECAAVCLLVWAFLNFCKQPDLRQQGSTQVDYRRQSQTLFILLSWLWMLAVCVVLASYRPLLSHTTLMAALHDIPGIMGFRYLAWYAASLFCLALFAFGAFKGINFPIRYPHLKRLFVASLAGVSLSIVGFVVLSAMTGMAAMALFRVAASEQDVMVITILTVLMWGSLTALIALFSAGLAVYPSRDEALPQASDGG